MAHNAAVWTTRKSITAATRARLLPAACVGDLDGNRAVDMHDLLLVIQGWGECAAWNGCGRA